MILYRPVGVGELRLIAQAEFREFPPRLPDQPIFYPVLTLEYAKRIARDWNTVDAQSVFNGLLDGARRRPFTRTGTIVSAGLGPGRKGGRPAVHALGRVPPVCSPESAQLLRP
jgi:hypothetical protein